MTYAIIETGGKQMMVEPGRFYDIDLLHVEPGESVTIDKVLFVRHEDDVRIGQPWVEGATVEGTVLQHRRGRKILVYKMLPKKKTRKKRGHRQELTRFAVKSISMGGSVLAEADIPEPAPMEMVAADEPEAADATAADESETPDMVSTEAE